MKTAITRQIAPAPVEAPSPRQAASGWRALWFTPIPATGLGWLRLFAGLLFIGWLLPLGGDVEALFGLNGWFDRAAYEQARELQNAPEFGWSLLYLAGENAAALKAIYWAALAFFLLFALGVCVRVTAVVSWLMVVSFLASPAASYDADTMVAMIAFYLMIGYVFLGQWSRRLTPAERILGPNDIGLLAWIRGKQDHEPVPSYAANLAVRLLQVHFAIAVVISGLYKLQDGFWWSGWSFWFPLHAPFDTTQAEIEAERASGSLDLRYFALGLAAYLTLAWQIGFPLFAWKKRWRPLLLGGAAVGWLGCALLYKLPVFGPVYMIGCLSFLTPDEWAGQGRVWEKLTGGAGAAQERRGKFQPRAR